MADELPSLPPRPNWQNWLVPQTGLEPGVERVWGRMQRDPALMGLLRALNMVPTVEMDNTLPGNAVMGVNPLYSTNKIGVNPNIAPNIVGDNDIAGFLRHELEHVRQFTPQHPDERVGMFIGEARLPYSKRPTEVEAQREGYRYATNYPKKGSSK